MNITFENSVKFAVSVVLAALITLVIAKSISQQAGTDLQGKPFVAAKTLTQTNAPTAS